MSSPSYWKQPTWVVNKDTGDNKNSGIDSAHAVKSLREVCKRLKGAEILQSTSIKCETDILKSNSDYCELRGLRFIGANAFLKVQGNPVSSGTTGTIATATPPNRASNLAWHITFTGVPDVSSYEGKKIRLTSGANSGAIARCTKDLGGGVLETTPFVTYSNAVNTTALPTIITPSNGDGFRLETITRIDQIIAEFEPLPDHAVSNRQVNLTFEDIDMIQALPLNCPQGITAVGGSANTSIVGAFGCVVCASMHGGGLSAVGSKVQGLAIPPGGWIDMLACHISSRFTLNVGALARVDYDSVSRGSTTDAVRMEGGELDVGAWGIFDMTRDGIRVEYGNVFVSGLLSGTQAIYGSGQTGVGLNILATASVQLATNTGMTITGAGGQIKAAGVIYNWDQVPFIDPGTGISISVWDTRAPMQWNFSEPDIPSLEARDMLGVTDVALCMVRETRQIFEYDPNDTTSPVNHSSVLSATPAGRWLVRD